MSKSKKRKKTDNKGHLLITVLVAVLVFISNIGVGGVIGSTFSGFLFGIMGLVNYIFPFYLCIIVLYYIIKRKKAGFLQFLFFFFVFILAVYSCELFTLISKEVANNPIEAYTISRLNKTGGGFLGACFSFVIVTIAGKIVAFIIDVLAIIFVIAKITGFSFPRFIFDRYKKFKVNRKNKRKRHKKEKKKRARRKQNDKVAVKTTTKQKSNYVPKHTVHAPVQEDIVANDIQKKVSRIDNTVRGIDFDSFNTVSPTPIPVEDEPLPIESNPLPEIEPELIPIDISNMLPDVEPVALDPVFEPELPIIDISDIEPEPIPILNEPEISIEPSFEHIKVSESPEYLKESEENIVPNFESIEAVENSEYLKEPEEYTEVPKETVAPVFESVIANEISENTNESNEIVEPDFKDDKDVETAEYMFPPLDLLTKPTSKSSTKENLSETADKLINTLNNFGVEATVSEINRGPAITRFEIIPAMGTKVSKILNLADDIKLNLAATNIRIEAPIPGKSAVGIEVPNKEVDIVNFRELIESSEFLNAKSPIAFSAGKDLSGATIIADIAKMPHVLIAGATGSGKSVCINTIIMSILYKASPDQVKFIMIDPKIVELSVYNGIPHLLAPVVSDAKKAAGALNWAVNEMNDRYQKFAALGVRDMTGYNKKISAPDFIDETKAHKVLSQIVIIIDELADLMMVAKSEVEESIVRLTQLARACGIYLIIATQRPSVDVITGLIKANTPSRIAFAVTSGVDSRTILDINGAEKLLGKGDMLYFPQGLPKPIRVQGAFVSDDEVISVAEFIREHNVNLSSDKSKEAEIEKQMSISESSSGASSSNSASSSGVFEESRDEYFETAGRLIIEKEKGSIGMLQRNLKIGFNRAARIMDQLAEAGVVGPEEGTKPRKILVSESKFEEILNEEN